MRPWVEDRRSLGIMVVQRLTLCRGDDVTPIALDDPSLDHGWWAFEQDVRRYARWTNGNAVLPGLVGEPAIPQVTFSRLPAYLLAETPKPPAPLSRGLVTRGRRSGSSASKPGDGRLRKSMITQWLRRFWTGGVRREWRRGSVQWVTGVRPAPIARRSIRCRSVRERARTSDPIIDSDIGSTPD
jgi:hypothetical protein